MRYVTSIERLARQEGIELGVQQGVQQGLQQGVQQGIRESIINILQVRFGQTPEDIDKIIYRIENLDTLQQVQRQAVLAESLAVFVEWLNVLD